MDFDSASQYVQKAVSILCLRVTRVGEFVRFMSFVNIVTFSPQILIITSAWSNFSSESWICIGVVCGEVKM